MASTKTSRTRQAAIAAGLIGLAVLLVCWFIWWTRPPQMGADKEVAKSVDALFTAVTAKDEKLLGQCEQRLHSYMDVGKLPAEAWSLLDTIMHKARAGHWQSAAERLYEFMRAQRRDGRQDHAKKMEKSRANSSRK